MTPRSTGLRAEAPPAPDPGTELEAAEAAGRSGCQDRSQLLPEPAQQLRSEGRAPSSRGSHHLPAQRCGTKERPLPRHGLPQHTPHLAAPGGSLQLTGYRGRALSVVLGSGRLWHWLYLCLPCSPSQPQPQPQPSLPPAPQGPTEEEVGNLLPVPGNS